MTKTSVNDTAAIVAFSLSLLGTFLVRSGVLISVHAFAVDPSRGVYMLIFFALTVGLSLSLYAWRAQTIRSIGRFHLFSRETMLLSNSVILFVVMLTILIGTVYPLIIQALGLGKISVGLPYFNAVFAPLMMIMFFFMGLGPFFRWQQMNLSTLYKETRLLMLAAALATLIPLWWFVGHIDAMVALGLMLALWVTVTSLRQLFRIKKRTQLAMIVAHLGVAVCAIGIILSSAYSVERNVRMDPGDSTSVGPYKFKLLGLRDLKGPNYEGVEAGIVVSKNGNRISLLKPQERYYSVKKTSIGKTAIDIGVFRDLYVSLGESIGKTSWSLRIYYKPFVRWIWFGGLLMMLGGILALTDKRYRSKRYLAMTRLIKTNS